MRFKRVKHTLLRMSTEEKVIALGAFIFLVGSFMPWQSVTRSIGQEETVNNAFSGHIGVIGFVVALMTLLALFYLLAEHVHVQLPQFGYKKSQILFFLMGQSFFLTLLTLAIYTKYSIQFVDAGLRFGLYISLAGTFLGAFAAFAKVQKVKATQVKQFFHQEDEENEMEQAVEEDQDLSKPQPMYFGEDKEGPVISPAFQASKPDPSFHNPEPEPPTAPEQKTHHSINQASFFSKEAGLK